VLGPYPPLIEIPYDPYCRADISFIAKSCGSGNGAASIITRLKAIRRITEQFTENRNELNQF
jgi:hypothetical protein